MDLAHRLLVIGDGFEDMVGDHQVEGAIAEGEVGGIAAIDGGYVGELSHPFEQPPFGRAMQYFLLVDGEIAGDDRLYQPLGIPAAAVRTVDVFSIGGDHLVCRQRFFDIVSRIFGHHFHIGGPAKIAGITPAFVLAVNDPVDERRPSAVDRPQRTVQGDAF